MSSEPFDRDACGLMWQILRMVANKLRDPTTKLLSEFYYNELDKLIQDVHFEALTQADSVMLHSDKTQIDIKRLITETGNKHVYQCLMDELQANKALRDSFTLANFNKIVELTSLAHENFNGPTVFAKIISVSRVENRTLLMVMLYAYLVNHDRIIESHSDGQPLMECFQRVQAHAQLGLNPHEVARDLSEESAKRVSKWIVCKNTASQTGASNE